MIAVASFSTREVITSSPSAVAFASSVLLSTGEVLCGGYPAGEWSAGLKISDVTRKIGFSVTLPE
jgi:hypothetical protein